MTRLANKVAIITGGAGGIGKATARRFLEEGAKVVIVDMSAAALESARNELSELGDIRAVQADVTKEEDVANYVKETVDTFGTVDILFNNAGIEGKIQPLVDVAAEDFEKVQAVNVLGVFLGLKRVLPVLTEKNSGSIINMSSNAGLDGTANLSPLCREQACCLRPHEDRGARAGRQRSPGQLRASESGEHQDDALHRVGFQRGGLRVGTTRLRRSYPPGPLRRVRRRRQSRPVPRQRREHLHHRCPVPRRRRHGCHPVNHFNLTFWHSGTSTG